MTSIPHYTESDLIAIGERFGLVYDGLANGIKASIRSVPIAGERGRVYDWFYEWLYNDKTADELKSSKSESRELR